MTFSLRPACPGDADSIAEFQRTAWQDSYAWMLPADYLEAASLQRGARWQERLRSGARQVVVAEQDGAVVGVASWRDPSRSSAGPVDAELKSLYVAAKHQQCGVGSSLLEFALAQRSATLWVFEDNIDAQRFYAKHGFHYEGKRQVDVGTGLWERRFSRGTSQPTAQRHSVDFEWGLNAAQSARADVIMVVDVLSFTTTLSIAVDAGLEVMPYEWDHDRAAKLSTRHGVRLAGRHRDDSAASALPMPSLSPGAMRQAVSAPAATPSTVMIESPNGARICHQLAYCDSDVLGVSLRNAGAAARWVSEERRTRPALSVLVLAAGEQWSDGSLRPAVEDLVGAGAVIAALVKAGWPDVSPEARAAEAGYHAVSGQLAGALRACRSGQELIAAGRGGDTDIAAEIDSSSTIARLHGFSFRGRRIR